MKRNDILEQAEKIRADMNKVGAVLTDEQAIEAVGLYEPWREGMELAKDDRIRRNDKLYKVLQPHTTQADWLPENTPALYVEVAALGEYREIKDNMLSTEAFAKDEIGWYQTETNLYKSLIDNNVWTPETYPAGWEQVIEE